MQKMNVIAKISCYLERGVVTLKSRKEYLNSVTHATSFGVTNCQKQSGFFGPPCICSCCHISLCTLYSLSKMSLSELF